MVRLELLAPRSASGRHGHDSRASGASAGDVVLGVPDDDALVRLHAVTFVRSLHGDVRQRVAVGGFAAEGAEVETVPDAERAQA